jgi:hypothetical protein
MRVVNLTIEFQLFKFLGKRSIGFFQEAFFQFYEKHCVTDPSPMREDARDQLERADHNKWVCKRCRVSTLPACQRGSKFSINLLPVNSVFTKNNYQSKLLVNKNRLANMLPSKGSIKSISRLSVVLTSQGTGTLCFLGYLRSP